MKILILGGTKFLGRYLAQVASARGHEITLFNRGQTNPDLFPEIKKLRGNRDGNLDALRSGRWHTVIDTSGQTPDQVRATAEMLGPSIEHYTFISSISAYADFSCFGIDETSPTIAMSPGKIETENDSATYGARKALCEQVAEKMMPGKVLVVRPGVIVGPHDPTERFTYWVRRVAKGGEILAPESSDKPIQLIDVRDLAEWIVQMAEKRQVGVFNASGPREVLTFGQMLHACKDATGSDARFTWADGQFLLDKSVKPFSELPLWIPEKYKDYAGHYSINSDRAFQRGLICRPIEEIVRDILLLDPDSVFRDKPMQEMGHLTADRERELLSEWKSKA